MNKYKDRIGLSLLEIIVAMLILSLVMYGLTTLFMASKSYVNNSGSRALSMEVAKFFFEGGGLEVTANNYTTNQNCLYNDSACADTNVTYNGIRYNVTYHTENVTNSTLRKVIINVSWVEKL